MKRAENLMDQFDPSEMLQGEWAMKKFNTGGEFGMHDRPMLVSLAKLYGYNTSLQAVTGRKGRRRLGLDMPVEEVHTENYVAYSTTFNSLWCQEIRAVEKQDDGSQGLVLDGSKVVQGGRVTRKLIEKPTTAGFKKLSSINEWFQGIVMLADLLADIPQDYQHEYSERYTNEELIHQHRVSFHKQVWIKWFAGLKDRAIALRTFEDLEARVRKQMMQERPDTWVYDPHGPTHTCRVMGFS